MTKAQFNVVLSLLFIVIAKQYDGAHVSWVFWGLAVIFALRAVIAYGRFLKWKQTARPDFEMPPGAKLHRPVNRPMQ